MKIILLREKGRSRALKVSRHRAAAAAFVLLAVTTISGYTLIDQFSQGSVGASTVAQWRDRLAVQDQEVESIRQRSDAESQAVGRQLAQMQARLLRMEALGARITEVADLDEGEFSFAEPAPQGGPVAASQTAPVWSDLRVSLEQLSAGLKVRESELEILESMLLNRDYQAAKEVAGRPVTWGWMSSKYGQRIDPFTGKSAWHAGVDFAGKDRSDVIAVASGVVTHAAKRSGYGLMVEITHGDGYVTRYGHHAEVLVQAGDIVQKGQVIGQMGSSGRATGPHVHFEVLKNGKHVDPTRYVARAR
jgi:murein DD-endopeptidase MepM/ murein hydrolase activator NlpD